jgi:hypothetical protein
VKGGGSDSKLAPSLRNTSKKIWNVLEFRKRRWEISYSQTIACSVTSVVQVE